MGKIGSLSALYSPDMNFCMHIFVHLAIVVLAARVASAFMHASLWPVCILSHFLSDRFRQHHSLHGTQLTDVGLRLQLLLLFRAQTCNGDASVTFELSLIL